MRVAFAIERLIRRSGNGLRIADGVLAAVLAHGVTLATDLWVAKGAPNSIQEALTQPSPGDIHADRSGARLSGAGHRVHDCRRDVPQTALARGAVGGAAPRRLLHAGHRLHHAVLDHPDGADRLERRVRDAVRGRLTECASDRADADGGPAARRFPPRQRGAKDTPDTTENGDRGRRYFVTLEDGPPLDVTVVDREQQAQGFFYRVWRNLTLRGLATRRSLQSLRQALEQEALLAYAAIVAGANAPKLIATSSSARTP